MLTEAYDYWTCIYSDCYALSITTSGIPDILFRHLEGDFKRLYLVLRALKINGYMDLFDSSHIMISSDDVAAIVNIGVDNGIQLRVENERLIKV